MARTILGITADNYRPNEVSYRVRNPNAFQGDTFVTVNIGEHHRLVRAVPKRRATYFTQSVRVDKEYADLPEEMKVTKRLIEQAKSEKFF